MLHCRRHPYKSTYNIKDDLDILNKYNVATPRWADFFETHKRDSAGYQLITYTTENKRAPVRMIKIVKENSETQSIQVVSHKKNLISEQEMRIIWDLRKGFSIQNTSQLLIRKPSEFRMEISY